MADILKLYKVATKAAYDSIKVKSANNLYFVEKYDNGPALFKGEKRYTVSKEELDNILNGYSKTGHTHGWTEINNKPAQATRWPNWTEVTSKPTEFKPAAHKHDPADININSSNRFVTDTEKGKWNTASTNATNTKKIVENIKMSGSTTPLFKDGEIIIPTIAGPKGEKGDPGVPGKDGVNGVKGDTGAAGKNAYTHIKYSANANGSGMVDTPTASTIYMGVYSGTSSTAPTATSSYKWFKTQGPQGPKGATGAKGDKGAKGDRGDMIVNDTRNTDEPPSFYFNSGRGGNWEFKNKSTIKVNTTGLLGTGGTYCTLQTIIPWGDKSGGYPIQIAYDNQSNLFCKRVGTSDTTWSAWELMKGSKGDTGPKGATGAAGKDGFNPYWKTTGSTILVANNGERDLKGAKGDTGAKGDKGVNAYTHIKYSASSNGSGMVDTPTASTIYMGVYSGTSSTAPTSTSSYKWFKTQGPQGPKGGVGAKGDTGAAGKDGFNPYWKTTGSTILVANNGERDLKGPKGDTGAKGDPGAPGKDGVNGVKGDTGAAGKNAYTHIKYSASSNGSGMVDTPTASTIYMGVYSGTSSTAPTSTSSYKWFKTQGPKGATGATGTKGADGRGVKWTSMFGVPVTTNSTAINGTIKPSGGIECDKGLFKELFTEVIETHFCNTNNISLKDYGEDGYDSISLSASIKALSSDVKITAGGFFEMSDIRLKENINELYNGEFRFCEYNFKSDESKSKHYGVIAQDVEKTHPELVDTNREGVLSVNYIELLIKDNISLHKKVDELENRLKHLEEQINK